MSVCVRLRDRLMEEPLAMQVQQHRSMRPYHCHATTVAGGYCLAREMVSAQQTAKPAVDLTHTYIGLKTYRGLRGDEEVRSARPFPAHTNPLYNSGSPYHGVRV